ncbi:hypothetical protein EQU24_18825 [Methylotuvimicrobium buryatense]|uniref:Uncharacterized protein n=1 Tax=Methylotuvimicrobium buryatense TaxID=95641 RepID=A0A4P9URF2_METBY|nr:hypothetical protein EQU24_18825 [Methylotuvimicrobium buryatense]
MRFVDGALTRPTGRHGYVHVGSTAALPVADILASHTLYLHKANHFLSIPNALQISVLAYGGAWGFGKGFGSMDAVIEPTWAYSRRPLTGTPAPKFD